MDSETQERTLVVLGGNPRGGEKTYHWYKLNKNFNKII